MKKITLDWTIFFLTFGLILFGLVMIYNTSSVSALNDFNNPYFYLKEQATFVLLGLGIIFFMAFFDYHKLYYLSLPGIIITILCLIAVFLPGIGVGTMGAHRWLNLGFTTIQPAEMAKLAVIIYLSAWFSGQEKGRLAAFLVLFGLIISLIMVEPDMGTTMIIALIFLILYFLSGAPWKHFLFILPLGITGIFAAVKIAPYRFERWLTFLDSTRDLLGKSYHINQVLIAIGSGGLLGLGLGKSRQKYAYLPEATTDSIFAIIAEELGFIGCLFLLLIFAALFYKMFQVAHNAPDRFGRLLGFGICVYLITQTLVNLGAMTVVIPLTGVPLPFISYGGSALLVEMASIGIMLNISSHEKQNGK